MPTISPLPGIPRTVGGVQLFTRIDPFEGGIDERGRPWRSVAYLCAGEDVSAGCDALKGTGASVGGIYPQPDRYPNNTNLVCLSVRFALKGPRSKGPQLVTSPYGEIYCTYGVPEFDVFGSEADQTFFDPADGDTPIPWASYQVRAGLETFPWPIDPALAIDPFLFVPLAGGAPGFGAGVTPDLNNLEYRLPVEDWIMRRSMIPNFLAFKYLHNQVVGKVNSNVMWGWPAGHFLMEPLDYEPCWEPGGKKLGEFTVVVRWRKEPWNKIPVPGHFGYFQEVQDRQGNTKYQSASFRELLRFGL